MGSAVLKIKAEGTQAAPSKVEPSQKTAAVIAPVKTETAPMIKVGDIYASPGVRRLATELNIDLSRIKGTGLKNRIQKEDLLGFIKSAMTQGGGGSVGSGLPAAPVVDFSQFGQIEADRN
jgi:pyruvate dehydrogenase E2 component (dihydrolipoamide acetyltransferase)